MAGTYSRVKTWASGNTLDASDLNAEFDNILNNSDPDGIDDASTNATAMQATADPYPAASESLATDLRGELQRIRYVMKQITGETNWYVDPDTTMALLQTDKTYPYQRSKFVWTSDEVLTIEPGVYQHNGTSIQTVYWNSDITFTMGANGDAMDASKWHYIYLDDSAIVTKGTALLDNTCFANYSEADSDNVPAWSDTKHGWYGTGVSDAKLTDRCIYAIYSDSGSDFQEVFQSGDFVSYTADISDLAPSATIDDTYTDQALTMPAFATKARVNIYAAYVDTTTTVHWRVNGQAGAGFLIGGVAAGSTESYTVLDVVTDSAQKIEIKLSAAGDNTIGLKTQGWYFPIGM